MYACMFCSGESLPPPSQDPRRVLSAVEIVDNAVKKLVQLKGPGADTDSDRMEIFEMPALRFLLDVSD